MKTMTVILIAVLSTGCALMTRHDPPTDPATGQSCRQHLRLNQFPVAAFDVCDFKVVGWDRTKIEDKIHEARTVAYDVTKCLDRVYDRHITDRSENARMPGIDILHVKAEPWVYDGDTKISQGWPRQQVAQWCPTNPDSIFAWAGELHSMYRVQMFGEDSEYNSSIPLTGLTSKAQRKCIDTYKP